MKKSFHIDNGGYVFEIAEMGLKISFDFFGYCPTEINLTNMDKNRIRELGVFLISASDQMNEGE